MALADTSDPRVERSRAQLIDALDVLLRTRDPQDISISALCAQAGVSRPKIRYLYDLASRVGDGRLDLDALDSRPDTDVVEAITSVLGLGRWSAEMFLIFRLNRPDVWPTGDLGIIKGVQTLFEMKRLPAPRTMERLAKPWRPYRSVAAWYLWRIHDL